MATSLYGNTAVYQFSTDGHFDSQFFPLKIILQQVFTQHGVAALLDCSLKMVQQTFLFAYPKDIPSSIFSLLTE